MGRDAWAGRAAARGATVGTVPGWVGPVRVGRVAWREPAGGAGWRRGWRRGWWCRGRGARMGVSGALLLLQHQRDPQRLFRYLLADACPARLPQHDAAEQQQMDQHRGERGPARAAPAAAARPAGAGRPRRGRRLHGRAVGVMAGGFGRGGVFARVRGLAGLHARIFRASAPRAAGSSGSPRYCLRSSGRTACRGRRAG